MFFECKIHAFSLIFTILMIFAGVQYRNFRKMTQFWSVPTVSLRFLRVFNFPIRCGSVLRDDLGAAGQDWFPAKIVKIVKINENAWILHSKNNNDIVRTRQNTFKFVDFIENRRKT